MKLEVREDTLYTERARFENDCLFQCIAELLDIEIDVLPDISEDEEWLDDLNKWLVDLNMKAVYHLPITIEEGTFVQSDPAILIWKMDVITHHATLLEDDDHYDPDDLEDDLLTDLVGYLSFEVADVVDQYLAFEYGETDGFPWGKDGGWNPNSEQPGIYPSQPVQPYQPNWQPKYDYKYTINTNGSYGLDHYSAIKYDQKREMQEAAEEFVFKKYNDVIPEDWSFFNPLDAKREYYAKKEKEAASSEYVDEQVA